MSPIKKNQKKLNLLTKEVLLNGAISIAGIVLLGFIFSFSRNVSHGGIPIDVVFADLEKEPRLAIDVYEQNPIKDIKVEVLNGCGVAALASKTTEFLQSKNIDVIKSDNADHHNYRNTLIIQRNEKYNSLKKIVETFGIYLTDSTRIKILPDESLDVDVTVILGSDYTTFEELNTYISSSY